jgi:hypothetical protein
MHRNSRPTIPVLLGVFLKVRLFYRAVAQQMKGGIPFTELVPGDNEKDICTLRPMERIDEMRR